MNNTIKDMIISKEALLLKPNYEMIRIMAKASLYISKLLY